MGVMIRNKVVECKLPQKLASFGTNDKWTHALSCQTTPGTKMNVNSCFSFSWLAIFLIKSYNLVINAWHLSLGAILCVSVPLSVQNSSTTKVTPIQILGGFFTFYETWIGVTFVVDEFCTEIGTETQSLGPNDKCQQNLIPLKNEMRWKMAPWGHHIPMSLPPLKWVLGLSLMYGICH